MPDSDDTKVAAGRVTWDISISTIIAVILAAGSGLYFAAQTRSQVEESQKNLVRLEASVQQGFRDMNGQLATLPDQRAHLAEIDRRLAEFDRARIEGTADRTRMRDQISQLIADLATMQRLMQLAPVKPQSGYGFRPGDSSGRDNGK